MTTTGDIADLQFSNLKVGEQYIITGTLRHNCAGSDSVVEYRSAASGAGTLYGSSALATGGGASVVNHDHQAVIFTAESDTLYVCR